MKFINNIIIKFAKSNEIAKQKKMHKLRDKVLMLRNEARESGLEFEALCKAKESVYQLITVSVFLLVPILLSIVFYLFGSIVLATAFFVVAICGIFPCLFICNHLNDYYLEIGLKNILLRDDEQV